MAPAVLFLLESKNPPDLSVGSMPHRFYTTLRQIVEKTWQMKALEIEISWFSALHRLANLHCERSVLRVFFLVYVHVLCIGYTKIHHSLLPERQKIANMSRMEAQLWLHRSSGRQ